MKIDYKTFYKYLSLRDRLSVIKAVSGFKVAVKQDYLEKRGIKQSILNSDFFSISAWQIFECYLCSCNLMSILPHSNKRWFNPITIKTNFVFVIVVTLFLALAGWLMQAGILPSLVKTSFSQRYFPWNTFIPSKIWMQLAVILSLILPTFVLLVCWRKYIVRRMMLLYVVVLLVQISTEITFTKLGLLEMNLIIGFTYTSYRVWQLWYYQQQMGKQNQISISGIRRSLVMAVFVSGIVFWTINWLQLSLKIVTRIIGSW
jgi:hypothetical protein